MGELFSVLDSLATDDVHAIAELALLDRAETLLTARNRLDAEIARSLQAADARQVTVTHCGRTTRSWLVEEQLLGSDEAARRMKVARMLPYYPVLAAAMAAGEVTHEHVRVILRCLRGLPLSLHEAAEAELTEAAKYADPGSLGRLCREIRTRMGVEDAEAAAERRYASRWLTASHTLDGMVHLEGMLDPESGATLTAALTPLMQRLGSEDDRTTGQRRADALADLARFSLRGARLPDHNGDRPHVMVTIPWSELRNGIGAGQLSHATLNGYEVTPATARRLACDADIIPVVLGGRGEVLDLGRSSRLFSRAQRRARALEDGGCVWPKCQAGLDRCHVHHLDFWWQGGRTDKDRGANLCSFHHWLVHHTNWTINRKPAGRIEVHRT